MKLLRRKTKSFDIQVEDLTLHITASDDFAEESRAQALSFWEQIQSYALRNPEFRRSKRPLRRVARDAPGHRPRDRRRVARAAGVGPMFTFRGAVTDQVGRFLAGSLSEVTVARATATTSSRRRSGCVSPCGDAAASRSPSRGPGQGAGSGCPRRSGAVVHGAGPDGLAVLRDVVHARRRRRGRRPGVLPKEDGFGMALNTCSGCRACTAASSWSGSGSASRGRRGDRRREPDLARRTRAGRSEAPRRGARASSMNHHCYRYHVLDDPEVADVEYDELVRELRSSRTDSPSSSRPTRRRSGWARRPPTCSRRSPIAHRCSRSTTRSRSRSWRRGPRASSSGLGATPPASRAS